jgi:hypothetical protein
MIDATALLRLYAARRRAQLRAQDAPAAQRRVLLDLVRRAARTQFGVDHGFADIQSVADFQSRVPLRGYEALWEEYWKPSFPRLVDRTWPGLIPYFAVTSGTTTGETKYIPCSRAILTQNRDATMDLITHHLTNRPRSRLFGGRNFMLGGSTQLKEASPGVWCGDLSGIAGRHVPIWAKPYYFPPRRLETIADWEEKIARFAPASLDVDIRSIGGTPSWLLLFLNKLAELRPHAGSRLASFYPNLELVVHGGVNFAPYRAPFEDWLEGSHAELREVYPASEGFIAVADRGGGEGLRMVVDRGLFFEFVPLEELEQTSPRRHWLGNAETGVNYALIVSSCAGLWAYRIGDTVRLVERDPPRLLITGRTSYSLSAFGEHLIGEEIETAVATAAAATDTRVVDYSVGALVAATAGAVGRHLFIVEFDEGPLAPQRMAAFRDTLDRSLSEQNEDYRVHRAGGFGMARPWVHQVAAGTYAAWMKSRGKLGGQNKVPRVINDPKLFEALRLFVGIPGATPER